MSSEPYPLRAVSAPCKVNLTLDVFAPRTDGFHDLDSIVVKLSPSDLLHFRYGDTLRERVELHCSDPALPTDSRNLAYRAAQLLLDGLRIPGGVQIHLKKRLPYQAGLGSASSDAATVLRSLSKLFDTPAETALAAAREIGSDVPLFLLPGAVRMQGRGDIVESIHLPPPQLFGVLVKPHVGVPTPTAYRLLDALPGRVPGAATQNLLSVLQSKPNDLTAIASALGNDFEAAILPAFPEVQAAHQSLTDAGAIRALLCGSGAACFGLAESAAHAETIAETLRTVPDQFAWIAVAESLP